MLIEEELFDKDHPPPTGWGGDSVILFSTFDALVCEGLSFDGVIDGCAFTGTEFYWGFFNCALVARTRFEACRFPGASFRGCIFVDCEFVDCAFVLDNLGGDCTIDGCTMAACRFVGCSWTTKGGRPTPDITDTRWLGCTQERCSGLAGIF